MNADDFRRIALQQPGAEEGSHMGAADFRVGGRIFATLASEKLGFGNIKLTPEQQAEFLADRPDVFLPVHGGWGRGGMTHIRLAVADEATLAGVLHAAWKLRVQLNDAPRAGAKARNSALPRAAPRRAVIHPVRQRKDPPT